MRRARLELADVVRAHRDRFVAGRGGRISGAERRVLSDIASCRTAEQGGHVERCDSCGILRIAYNSCRNRHCPKCQEQAGKDWVTDRGRDVLPVEYFHVVFSIPHELARIALQNKSLLYGILFRACAETLATIASDPKHLGAEIGFLAVLHTWGSNLEHHPHLHCLIPGGGLSPDGLRWISCRRGFFLPVRVLGHLFRGKFLDLLKTAFEDGKLHFHGSLEPLRDAAEFRSYLRPLYKKPWVVYSKPPFGGPAVVLKYLARYTHRVAISNSRLVSMSGANVTFTWKDYRHGGKHGILTLDGVEFLRRFLLHILPRGFVRVRHYGLLANRCRQAKLAICRRLVPVSTDSSVREATVSLTDAHRCLDCRNGRMVCVLVFKPWQWAPLHAFPQAVDSS